MDGRATPGTGTTNGTSLSGRILRSEKPAGAAVQTAEVDETVDQREGRATAAKAEGDAAEKGVPPTVRAAKAMARARIKRAKNPRVAKMAEKAKTKTKRR